MNIRTTIALLVLLLVCLVSFIGIKTEWFGLKKSATEPATPLVQKLLPDIGRVSKIAIDTPGVGKVALVGQGDIWRISDPIDAPANMKAVSLAYTLASIEYLHKFAPGDADFPKDDLTRLSKPERTIAFSDGKKTYTLAVGSSVAFSPRERYVQLAGDASVYTTGADLLKGVAATAGDYRDTKLFDFETDKVVGIEVKGREDYTLTKAGREWAAIRPVNAPADSAKVEKLLADLSALNVAKFVDDKPAGLTAYGRLDEPQLQVTVEIAPPVPTTSPATAQATQATQPSRRVTLLVGAGAGDGKRVFAKLSDSPSVFQIDAAKVDALQPKLADIRKKDLVDIGFREVCAIDLTLKQYGAAKFRKDKDQWTMVEPFPGQADWDSTARLVSVIQNLKAEEFTDNPASMAAFGLEDPQGKIVLHLRDSGKQASDGTPSQTLTVYLGKASSTGQVGFVRVESGRSVAAVPAADFAVLNRPPAAYWSRGMIKLPEDATIQDITIATPEGEVALHRAGLDTFSMSAPIEAPADQESINALLAALRTVDAQKIIALGKDLPERFAKLRPTKIAFTYSVAGPASAPTTASAPATSSAPTTSSAPSTRPAIPVKTSPTLVLVSDGGKAYGWLAASEPVAVGELDNALFDKITAEMRDRTVLQVSSVRASTVKMTLDKTELEFTRSGDAWRFTGDRFVKLDDKKIAEFIDGLAKVKARSFADYRSKTDLKRYGLDQPSMTIEVKSDDGKTVRLDISRAGPVGTTGKYAVSSETPGVFILAPEEPAKLGKSLDDFKKKEAPEPEPGPGPDSGMGLPPGMGG